MDDLRLGTALRALRIRRRWRQVDLAARVGVSRATVYRLERGHVDVVSIAAVRKIARELDAWVDLTLRWQGGELERLVNARHSALHEAFARTLGTTPGWVFVPEVSFSIYGERGVVDVLGWHAATRAVLIVELKSDLVDIQEHLATLDRKVRLSPRIASERGWRADKVGAWLLLGAGRTNRRRIEAHRTLLRSSLPDDGRRASAWLRTPAGGLRALSQMPYAHEASVRPNTLGVKRVRSRGVGGVETHPCRGGGPRHRGRGEQVGALAEVGG